MSTRPQRKVKPRFVAAANTAFASLMREGRRGRAKVRQFREWVTAVVDPQFVIGRSASGKAPVTKKAAPPKRKAESASGSDVEIVEGPPSPAKGSPSKSRTRPSERTNVAAAKKLAADVAALPRTPKSAPSTPRKVPRLAAHVDSPSTPSPTKSITRTLKSVAMVESSEDETMAQASEEDAITDPQFFDDQASAPVPDTAVQYDSEDYWHNVDNARNSDNAFINDDDEIGDDASDEEPVAPEAVKADKGKARASSVHTSDSDGERKPVAKRALKAVVVSSEEEDVLVVNSARDTQGSSKSLDRAAPRGVPRVSTSSPRKAAALPAKRSESPNVFLDAPANIAAVKSSKILKAMEQAGDGVSSSPVKEEKGYKYMADLEVGNRGLYSESSPAVCEVTNIADQDPEIDYTGICNLRVGTYRSWSQEEAPGWGTFSGWKGQCPEIYLKQLKRVWEFRDHQHIRNVSRTNPTNLVSKSISGGNTVLICAGTQNTVVQFTTILITTKESHLHSTQTILNDNRRSIEGIPQIVEWERMQAVLCMAYRIPYANVNMRAGAIVFCTAKTMKYMSGGVSPAKNPSAFYKRPSGSTTVVTSGSQFANPRPTVVGSAPVIVLDGRRRKFNLTDDLLRLDQLLPTYDDEVPVGSCVWVGFTSTKYWSSEKGDGLNFNLMWVVLLGTP
ncbi:hypothetical protein HWV62_33179 [Athelia sp. TMB]|nr:hypothetical protein HWV62_33179 [Athelia sp. TMB]